MTNSSVKHLQKRDDDHPALGNFVHWFIKQKSILKKDVAKNLEIAPTTLNQYFKQHSLQFGILWRLSQAINYNLVMDLGERLHIDYETKEEKRLKEELAQKEELIKSLEIELNVYRKLTKL